MAGARDEKFAFWKPRFSFSAEKAALAVALPVTISSRAAAFLLGRTGSQHSNTERRTLRARQFFGDKPVALGDVDAQSSVIHRSVRHALYPFHPP